MEKKEKEVRETTLKIRISLEELRLIKNRQSKSTEKSLSAYVRQVAMNEPVLINYRNESADDFLNDMLLLKKELHAIGNNFNQSVHKLHILDRIPEFREWIISYSSLHTSLIGKIEEIKLRMNQLYEQWLQK